MIEDPRRRYLARTSGLATASTLVLTASFIGVLSFIESATAGIWNRVPWYLVAAAVLFTATVVLLERHDASGKVIIGTATISGVIAFVVITLMIEGLFYTVRYPEEVFVTQYVLYFLAAGLLGTGIGYWGIQHWREFTPNQRSL